MTLIQDSPEWHRWRLSGIGASEIAAITGVDPYKNTPHSVWLVKTGRSKGFEGNSFTERGKELEAKARALYEFQNMEDMPAACATHPVYKCCLASLDGISADGKTILEIKCPTGSETINLAKANLLPDHYMAQVQYQMAVTGADVCHFFVFHEGSGEDALVKVRPNVAYQGELIAAAVEFWEKHVLADIAPALTEDDVKIVDFHPELLLLADRITAEKDTLKKSELDALKARFVLLGGHNKVKCGNVQVSEVKRKGVFSYHKLTVTDVIAPESDGRSA